MFRVVVGDRVVIGGVKGFVGVEGLWDVEMKFKVVSGVWRFGVTVLFVAFGKRELEILVF